MGGLGSFLVGLAGPLVRRVLLSLGMGFVGYAGVAVVVNQMIASAKASWSGIPADAMLLLQIGGVSTAFSIIVGSFLVKLSLNVVKRLEVLR